MTMKYEIFHMNRLIDGRIEFYQVSLLHGKQYDTKMEAIEDIKFLHSYSKYKDAEFVIQEVWFK